MTETPPDPLATQQGISTDASLQAPMDEQTLRLREENRALRELVTAQVQAALPSREPGPLRRLCWWLISAPGATLVGWRKLLNRDGGRPITGKRVGCATVTILYTLAIYGALVLLVVSWSSPNTARSGAAAAGPVRVPLAPLPSPGAEVQQQEAALASGPDAASGPEAGTQPEQMVDEPPVALDRPHQRAAMPSPMPGVSGTPPQSGLRITEIPAQDPPSWLDALRAELTHCASQGFFERPNCAWTVRQQYCEPRSAWGLVSECPDRP